MPNNVKISSLAQKELLESTQWYEDKQVGLSYEFSNVIKGALKVIEQTPEAFNETKIGYREYVVKKFPFIIVYKQIGDMIEILHFFHTSRNPKLKYRRKLVPSPNYP